MDRVACRFHVRPENRNSRVTSSGFDAPLAATRLSLSSRGRLLPKDPWLSVPRLREFGFRTYGFITHHGSKVFAVRHITSKGDLAHLQTTVAIRCLVEHKGLFVVGWLEAGWLFEDIQERGGAVDSVPLSLAYSFYDTRAFQPFDGALRGRKRDR